MLARVLCCAFLFCNAANAAIIKVNDDSSHWHMDIGLDDTLIVTAGAVQNVDLRGGTVEIHEIGYVGVISGFGNVIVTDMDPFPRLGNGYTGLLVQGSDKGPIDVSIQALSMRAPFDPTSNSSSSEGWLSQDTRARITIAPAFADCLGRCEDTVVKDGDTTSISWLLKDVGGDKDLGSITLANEITWGRLSTDGDGDIDIDDLNAVRNNFGCDDTVPAPIDLNGDGGIGLGDLNYVRNHFGDELDPVPAPEPSALLLTALGMCVLASAPLRCRCCSSPLPSP